MSLPHTSLHQSLPGELPNIGKKISNDVELSQWRECLYRAMTQRSKTAISHLLSAKLGIIDTISILNKRNDKTKKSQWATLQAIIQYKKNYAEKTHITADDVRIELEQLDRDFSGQRTVKEILGEIRTKASEAQIIERNAHLRINIAGFETPIVGIVRDTIITLLDAEQKSEKESEITPIIIPEKNPITTTTPPPPQITLPLQVTARSNIPRRIDAATLHRAGIAAIQRERAEKQKATPPIPPKLEKNTPSPVFSPKHPQAPKKFYHEKTTEETLTDHVAFVQAKENMEIVKDAHGRSLKNRRMDDVVFENYIRGKNIEILTRLQAIKRLKNYRSWNDVIVAITESKSDISSPLLKVDQAPLVPPESIPPTPPPTPIQEPLPQVTTIIPSNTPPGLIEEELGEEELEKMDFDTLCVSILENNEWMAFLRTLCQLHKDKKYGEFLAQWNAFRKNTENDTLITLWNRLFYVSKAKISTENEGISILEVVFEVCGYTFTKDDITLYTTRYSRKKRGPEIWKNITEYEDLLLHLDEIHSYNDLIPKMKAITVQIPDQREWLLYEEKICPVQSLQSIIETKLAQQYPAGPGRGQERKYLRDAKQYLRELSRKG